MKGSPQVTFHDAVPSRRIEEAVRVEAARLDRHADRVAACRVSIEGRPGGREPGDEFRVRLDLAVPGDRLVVTRGAGADVEGRDLAAAIRDAFAAADRLVEVEGGGPLPHARLRRLMPEQGCGQMEAANGRAVYFNKNSLVNADFDALATGTEVVFVPGAGDGATAVRVVGPGGSSFSRGKPHTRAAKTGFPPRT